jgi:hypothetical protein
VIDGGSFADSWWWGGMYGMHGISCKKASVRQLAAIG